MTARSRASVRLAVPLGIATLVIGVGAAPALAATSISIDGSHLSNGEVHQNDTLSVTGTGSATDPTGLAKARTVELRVRTPGDGTYTFESKSIASSRASDLSASFDTTCAPWSGCSEARNGAYTFVFDDGGRTATKDVTLLIPPAAPQEFTAAASGTVVTFDWQPNSEPDLMGYAVLDDGSDITQGGVDADSVCDGSGCEVTMDFGAGARGTSHDFALVALRHTSPGSSSSVDSAPSATRSVTFAAPPSPSAGGDEGGSVGGNDGSGGSGTGGHDGTGTGGGGGGSVGSAGGDDTVTGHHPAADLRNSLPTVTAGAAPDLPSVITEVKPLPQGTYDPVLPYDDQVTRERVDHPAATASSGVVGGIEKVLDTSALWRSLAGAAVLFLVAAHLHSWVHRIEVE